MPQPADDRIHQLGPHGEIKVPLDLLEEAGLGPKMRVRFRVAGKSLVLERAADAANPLDGSIGRKPDKDLFGKVREEQEREKERAREFFEKGLADAANDPDPEPPDGPFRWD